MFSTNILIAIGCLAVLVIFLIYNIASRKKNIQEPVENNSDDSQNYALNSKTQDDKKLTIQERIELSWQFLYDITEIILNKFSKEDIISVNKYGRILFENGAKYEHVVDLAVHRTKSHTQAVEQDQSKGKKRGM